VFSQRESPFFSLRKKKIEKEKEKNWFCVLYERREAQSCGRHFWPFGVCVCVKNTTKTIKFLTFFFFFIILFGLQNPKFVVKNLHVRFMCQFEL
jgi:hypothetical protein